MAETYNPFKKTFDKVDKNDLDVLKNISEGWFVEYKSIKQNGQKIARSISSFANSHGGLYFIGIEEDKITNYAKKIVGVKDSPDIVRDSLKGNLSHMPFFETFAIPLANGNHIIMVVVPEGENPPYINSDGKIYRRQGAGSDPIPETNRLIMDDLYNKAKNHDKKIEEFRRSNLGMTNSESEEPILEIYVNTKPFNKWFIEDFNKKDFIRMFSGSKTVKEGETSFNTHIPFDTLSTFHQGIYLRQIRNKDLAFNGLTFEMDVFGNAKFFIPLERLDFSSMEAYLRECTSSAMTGYSKGIYNIRILDGGKLFSLIIGLLNLHEDFLTQINFPNDLEVKFRLSNCHRTLLFFRSEKFVDYIEKNGLPICMKEIQYFPNLAVLVQNDEIKKDDRLLHLLTQSSRVLEALGVSHEISTIASFDWLKKISSLPSYNPS